MASEALQARCDWCRVLFSVADQNGIHADTGDGVIHFCGPACMHACLTYSTALLDGRAAEHLGGRKTVH